jgi:tetratricopeptide (TPR) repeat protein
MKKSSRPVTALIGILVVAASPAVRAQESGGPAAPRARGVVRLASAPAIRQDDDELSPTVPPAAFVSIEKPRDARIDARVAELRSEAAASRARGDADGVVTACRAALFLDNRNPELYADLADALLNKGICVEAMHRYREAIGVEPGQSWSASRMDQGDLHLRFALALLRCRCFEDAVNLYQMGVDRLPVVEQKRVSTRWNPASLRRDARERQKFEAAVRIALGLCYNASGMVDRAAEQMKAALTLSPAEPLAQFTLGNLLRAKGRRSEAQVAWQRAAEGSDRAVRGWATEALAQNR